MQQEGYCGLGLNFQIQDLCVTEGMGPIMDRAKEHLTPMDRPIVAARKLLMNAIRDLQNGREPANVAREPETKSISVGCLRGSRTGVDALERIYSRENFSPDIRAGGLSL